MLGGQLLTDSIFGDRIVFHQTLMTLVSGGRSWFMSWDKLWGSYRVAYDSREKQISTSFWSWNKQCLLVKQYQQHSWQAKFYAKKERGERETLFISYRQVRDRSFAVSPRWVDRFVFNEFILVFHSIQTTTHAQLTFDFCLGGGAWLWCLSALGRSFARLECFLQCLDNVRCLKEREREREREIYKNYY